MTLQNHFVKETLHEKIRRLDQIIFKLQLSKNRKMNHLELTPSRLRKARNRSLIQLGGLIAKSGILEKFDIEVGRDLQKDKDMEGRAATFYGALLEMKADIEDNISQTQRNLWKQKGKKELAK